MKPFKVLIENWQQPSLADKWLPIAIAIISLVVSLYSIYLTRQQFILSTRPYIHAAVFWDSDLKKILNDRFNITVTNSPAHVTHLAITLYYQDHIITRGGTEDYFVFPSEGSTWWNSFSKEEMNKIWSKAANDETNIFRTFEVRYTKLGGNTSYRTYIKQKFQGGNGTWETEVSEAN